MNVLVIPEDFRKDRYILQPLIEAIFQAAGKSRANVRVCKDPLLGGVEQAMNWERISEILDRYKGMVEIFILAVDRDGVESRRMSLDNLEAKAGIELGANRFYLENAWQEIEVWAVAGQDLLPGWSWQDIRGEIHPKERYFEPLARSRRLENEPGGGRKTLGIEAAKNYRRVKSRCPEDIGALESRLAAKFNE
jgi:hypothetical protein